MVEENASGDDAAAVGPVWGSEVSWQNGGFKTEGSLRWMPLSRVFGTSACGRLL